MKDIEMNRPFEFMGELLFIFEEKKMKENIQEDVETHF